MIISRRTILNTMLATAVVSLSGGAMLLADSMVPADRWWVGGLLDTWDDLTCWSLTEGGAPGGGLPTTDDDVHIVTDAVSDSIIIFYQNAADPLLFNLAIDGPGSALLSQQQDSLRTQYEVVGETGKGQLHVLGGTHAVTSELALGYSAGSDGRVQIQAPGILETSLLFVGGNGTGRITHSGGTHTNGSLITLGRHPGLFGGGDGTYSMTGGALNAVDLEVGKATGVGVGIGHFSQTGGVATVTGTFSVGPGSDATIDLNADLQVGAARVDGIMKQYGGGFDADDLDIVEPVFGSGSGRYELSGGALTTQNTLITTAGAGGGFDHAGGDHVISSTLTVGIGSFANDPGEYTLSNGDLTTSATEIANGAFHHLGGSHDAVGFLEVSDADYDLGGGTLYANSLYIRDEIGSSGAGAFLQTNGTATIWDTLLIERPFVGSSFATFELQGGTFTADTTVVQGEFTQSGGVFSTDAMSLIGDAAASVTTGADFRAFSVVNYGTFTQFGGHMAGRYIGAPFNTYQLGTFENRGELVYLGMPAGTFFYNFINYGTLSHTVSFTAGGKIVNHGTLTAASGRNITGGGSGLGITNHGTIELFGGSVISLYQPLANSGRLVGAGLIESGVTSDGLIAPGHSAGTITIEGTLDLSPASGLEIELGGYTPGTGHDEIVVIDDIILDGALKIVTLPGFAPAAGDEFTILRSDNGVVLGEFTDILGCSGARVRYEAWQVVLVFDAPCAASCPADTDGDGTVSVLDLLELLATWGPCPGFCAANSNGDGAVNVLDLLTLLAAWGACP